MCGEHQALCSASSFEPLPVIFVSSRPPTWPLHALPIHDDDDDDDDDDDGKVRMTSDSATPAIVQELTKFWDKALSTSQCGASVTKT